MCFDRGAVIKVLSMSDTPVLDSGAGRRLRGRPALLSVVVNIGSC